MPFPNPATQFQPGQSGNPGGRPKATITGALRDALERVEDDGRTTAEMLVDVLLRIARSGDLKAIREVFDRTEGRPRQSVAVEHGGGTAPIQWIEIMYSNDWRTAPNVKTDGPDSHPNDTDEADTALSDVVASHPGIKVYCGKNTPNNL